jgi:hypothetical protein
MEIESWFSPGKIWWMILDLGVKSFLKNQFSLLIIIPEKGFHKFRPPILIFI